MSQNIQVISNWQTLEDQPLSKESINNLFLNTIPCIRHRNFLSKDECDRLVEVINTHQIGTYNPQVVFPPIGSVGVSQFDFQQEKDSYLNRVAASRALQERFIREANVDILSRVLKLLHEVTGLPARIAKEGDMEYFAGLLRVMDYGVQIHADYGPYDGPDWEIGHLSGQLTWNVLLRQIPGGDTIIYDRPWQGKSDDVAFRKKLPSYAYSPSGLQGRIFKVMPPIETDLTFFNSRNFHEVKAIDSWQNKQTKDVRMTLSSFVGLLPPESDTAQPTIILWS
jgi:hypothetical protein